MGLNRRFVKIVSILLFGLISGCSVFNANYGLKGEPDSKLLVGRWVLSGRSSDVLTGSKDIRLSNIGPGENVIEMRDDGTCSFGTYPSFQSGAEHIITDGTWSLKRDESGFFSGEMWAVSFDLEPRPSSHVGSTMYLDYRNGDMKMFTFVGDPDRQEIVEFVRSQ